jgi:hypothetical protein
MTFSKLWVEDSFLSAQILSAKFELPVIAYLDPCHDMTATRMASGDCGGDVRDSSGPKGPQERTYSMAFDGQAEACPYLIAFRLWGGDIPSLSRCGWLGWDIWQPQIFFGKDRQKGKSNGRRLDNSRSFAQDENYIINN